MSTLFGLFTLKDTPLYRSTVAMRALIYATTPIKTMPSGFIGERGCGIIIGNKTNIFHGTHNDVLYLRKHSNFREALIGCGKKAVEENKNTRDWFYIYGYSNVDGIPSGRVIRQGDTVAAISGIIINTSYTAKCPYIEAVKEIDSFFTTIPWPDSLYKIKETFAAANEEYANSFHCILTSAKNPNMIVVISKNKDGLSIRTGSADNALVISNGTLQEKHKMCGLIGGINNTIAVHVPKTCAMLLNLESRNYAYI